MECECGCGQEVREGKRFVNHHNPNPMLGHHQSAKQKSIVSAISKCNWQDPDKAKRMFNGKRNWENPVIADKMRVIAKNMMQKRWQNNDEFVRKMRDPIFVKNRILSAGICPNKQEEILEKLLHPYGFKFIGDGQMNIGGKFPDFWDGKNKLIELFGDCWHINDDPQDRIDFFKQYGYDCLVIWTHELKLKNIQETVCHIKYFVSC